MSPRNDALVIDARLLLDYRRAAEETYNSVGVKKITDGEPYPNWLPRELGSDLNLAVQLQAARDNRLVQRLFDFKAKVYERGALDVAHMFVEAGGTVIVVSHETGEVLDALVARAGLPERVTKLSMIATKDRVELVRQLREQRVASWYAVYELGLTPKLERGMLVILGGDGILINAKTVSRSGVVDDQLLDLINERWSYD